ncbi:MAG: HDOD domain-containing protein [Deltaproteobacteria bacterium]|nr:HDOD domain-containing protein [Deltaproteobacteria bacterium]
MSDFSPINSIDVPSMVNISDKLKEIKVFPTFPSIVQNVIEALEDPKSSARDLAKRMDASITSEVLKIANSAYYGTRSFRKIDSIEHAIAVIGFQSLLSIVLQMPFLKMVAKGGMEFNEKEYLRHTILTATISKTLSKHLKLGDPSTLCISGIMHDVGKIVIYSLFRKEWKDILKLKAEQGLPSYVAERNVLGINHGTLGGNILDQWNIPESIVTSVMYHHEPELAKNHFESVKCVYLANSLAKALEELITDEKDRPIKDKMREKIFESVDVETAKSIVCTDVEDELFITLLEAKSLIRSLYR